MMDFDATSFYPSVSELQMINAYVKAFKDQSFNQDGNERAILKKLQST